MTKNVSTLVAALALLVGACAPQSTHPEEGATHDEAAPHWTYAGEGGAEEWGTLSTDFATCSIGTEQSPIDLPSIADATAPVLVSAHEPVPINFTYNGHTVQFGGRGGGGITVDGHAYALLQFHVHFPSEHTVAGRSYPGELHFVHADSSGALAVVGVLIEEGAANELFATAVAGLPTATEGEAIHVDGSLDPDAVIGSGTYKAYSGSLTTPPCSEGVRWFVMDKAAAMSSDQIAAFARMLGLSNRPVQDLDGRTVTSGTL